MSARHLPAPHTALSLALESTSQERALSTCMLLFCLLQVRGRVNIYWIPMCQSFTLPELCQVREGMGFERQRALCPGSRRKCGTAPSSWAFLLPQMGRPTEVRSWAPMAMSTPTPHPLGSRHSPSTGRACSTPHHISEGRVNTGKERRWENVRGLMPGTLGVDVAWGDEDLRQDKRNAL